MYSRRSGLVLAFHGTDKSIVKDVLLGNKSLEYHKNAYDWLGNGNYFWENSPSRALHYATMLMAHPERTKISIKNPAVIGAVLDLGNCLDFTDFEKI